MGVAALPWHQGVVLVAAATLAGLGRGAYARVALAAGLAVILSASWLLSLPALILASGLLRRHGIRDRALLAWGALALGAVATKQVVAARALEAASGRVLEGALSMVAVVAALALAGVVAEAGGARRVLAVTLATAGAVAVGQLGWVWAAPPGTQRLERAERAGAVALVYDGVLARARGEDCPSSCARDNALLSALVAAAPLRDEAALALGWRAALDAGWRPRRAEGEVVTVARELEARGRGGEAFRLLSRHPRDGEVDGFMSMMERTEGAPVHWRGGQLGPALPGTLVLDAELAHNGTFTLEFTATEALSGAQLRLEGTPYLGAPRVTVQLDAAPARPHVLDGLLSVDLGALAAGPHRLRVRFDDDLVDQGGDRNVVVRSLDAVAAP